MRLLGREVKAVIYDVDGPLVQSFGAIRSATKAAAQDLGYSVDVIDPYFAKCGTSGWQPSLELGVLAMWPNLNEVQVKAFCTLMRNYEKRTRVAATPGAYESVMRFRSARIALGLCTTNDLPALNHRLDCVGLGVNLFNGVCTAESPYMKPDPMALHYVMDQLYVHPDNTVFIGDWDTDLKAAEGAKVTFLALTSPEFPREKFRELGVPEFFIMDSMTELEGMFE